MIRKNIYTHKDAGGSVRVRGKQREGKGKKEKSKGGKMLKNQRI